MKGQKQKLNIFSFDFPPNSGGVARMMFEISQSMSNFASINVLTKTPVKLSFSDTLIFFSGTTLVTFIKSWWYLLTKDRKTPVVCSRWYPEGLISYLSGVDKYFVMTHGAEVLTAPGFKGKVLNWMKRKVFRCAERVISNSHFTDGLVSRFEPTTKHSVLNLAVDTERFKPVDPSRFVSQHHLDGKTVFSTVSRIQKHKGHLFILECLSKLPESDLDTVKYLIAGTGDYLSVIEQKVKELGLEEQVTMLGFVPEDKLCELYCASDLFLLCSEELLEERKVEGFGLVLLEAKACGVPVCGVNSGGIADAVHPTESKSFLIENNAHDQLLDVMKHCICRSEEYLEAKSNARQSVLDNQSWEHYSEVLKKIVLK